MKKFFISTILSCALVFSGCGTAAESAAVPTAESALFQAVITEVSDASILVRPVDGSAELASCDSISLPADMLMQKVKIGDKVEISYNGDIMESYPAQLGEVYSIKILSSEETTVKEEPVRAEICKGAYTMALTLPSGWIYDLKEYDSNDAQGRLFGISFSPEDNAAACVSVACCALPVGICGTGVTQETLDNPKGNLCTEEIDNEVWMCFIYDFDTDYYLFADGSIPSQIWAVYRESILNILSTLEFIKS